MKKYLWLLGTVSMIIMVGGSFLFIMYHSGEKEEIENRVDIEIMDGDNIDNYRGCFFIIRAGKGVALQNVDEFCFKIAMGSLSPRCVSIREWRWYSDDGNMSPRGGDRNMTYRFDTKTFDGNYIHSSDPGNYEERNEKWEEGEMIGIDIPSHNIGLPIIDNKVYTVQMFDLQGELLYTGTFRYREG